MLNAVWVAVIIATACWAVLVAAAVYVLIKLSRLITQTSATVTGLRENTDAVIARAHATIDATAGQLDRTDQITASMDQVAAGMAELTGRVTALAPLARLAAATSGTRLARVSAFVYGIRHAAELRATAAEARRAGGVSSPRQRSRGVPGGSPPGPAGRAGGVSSPRQLSRGVPGGRPPGPSEPAGQVAAGDRPGRES